MDLKKINFKDKNLQIGLIVLIVGFFLSFLWYQNMIKGQLEDLKALETDYQAKQDKLNNIIAMKPRLDQLKENVELLNHKLDSLRSIFPDQKELPKLIKEVTNSAHKAGVLITNFKPIAPVEKEHYVENGNKVTVVGGYHALARFFNYLAKFELIVNISDIQIGLNSEISSEIEDYKYYGGEIKSLKATFNLTTFSSKK